MSEQLRCFVNLPDGTKRPFPSATEVRDQEDGSIEIWNDRIYIDGFRKGEFNGYWMDPQFLIARKKEAERLKKLARRPKPRR
jgi:hypothetical protein